MGENEDAEELFWWMQFVNWHVIESGQDCTIAWMLLEAPNGERALAVCRTYREQTRVLRNAVPEDVQLCRDNTWALWNSGRLS